MKTEVSRAPAFFGEAVASPKENRVKSGMSTLPIEVLGNIARLLPDAALKALACTDSANRQVALKERVVRILSTAQSELKQSPSLALGANESNQSPIGTYISFLQKIAPIGQPALLPTDALTVNVTERLAQEIFSLKAELFVGIDNKVIGWDEIDKSSQKLQEPLVAKALIEIISASPTAAHMRRMAMQSASSNGHLEILRALLANGPYIWREDRGFVVWSAAAKGHLEIVRFLLAGGDISETTRALAVSDSALGGYLEIVQELLASGNICDRSRGSAVISAARGGHLEILRALLAHGNISIVDRCKAIKNAIGAGHYKIASELLPAKAILMTAFLGLTASYINSLQYQEEK